MSLKKFSTSLGCMGGVIFFLHSYYHLMKISIANVTVLGEMQRFHSIKRKEFRMSCLMAQGERFLPLNLLSERFVDLVFPLPSSSKNLGNLNLLGNLHVIAD